jgi:hypothetical protein
VIRLSQLQINSAVLYVLFYIEVLILGFLPSNIFYSLSGAIWLFLICLTTYFVGEVFVGLTNTKDDALNSVPTKIIIGTILTNVFLYAEAVFLPFGLLNNFYILLVVFSILYIKLNNKNKMAARKSSFQEFLVVLLVPLAVGFWCQDFYNILTIDEANVVLQVWQDVYFHIAQMNEWAASRGILTASDVQMVGAPSIAYHHASYMIPTLFAEASGQTMLSSYALIFVPFGIILMSLSAFTLAGVVFSLRGAAFASVGLLVLPDAFQLGYGNPYFSFHWLLQIGPALGYGIASAGIAFAYLFKFCDEKKYIYLFSGYFFACICMFLKAHIFVSISYLALVLPVFVYGAYGIIRRSFVFLGLTFIYFFAIESARVLNIGPTLALNGSALVEYSTMVVGMQPEGFIKGCLHYLFSHFPGYRAAIFMAYLSMISVALPFALYFGLVKKLHSKIRGLKVFFPLMGLFFYLVTATFLAYDANKVGAPEELLHRQFVWVYFVTAVWALAGCFDVVSSWREVGENFNVVTASFLIGAAIIVPYYYGRGIQANRIWGNGYQKIPKCKFSSIEFVKANSKRGETIQDSSNDPNFMVTAFSALPAYAVDSGGFRLPAGLAKRLADHADFKTSENPEVRRKFIANTGISWYLNNPADKFNGLGDLDASVVYSCDGYDVYYFKN